MDYDATGVFQIRDKEVNDLTADDRFTVATAVYRNGLLLGYSDGSIEVYGKTTKDNQRYEDGFNLISTITKYYDDDMADSTSSQESKLIGLRIVQYINEDVLIVIYSDSIAKYSIPSGILLAYNDVPLTPQGIDVSSNYNVSQWSIYIWGKSCEVIVVDGSTLEITQHIKSLPDWPVVTSYSDEKALIAFIGGGKISIISHGPNTSIEPFVSLPEHPVVDAIVSIKRISRDVFLVLYHNEWCFYRLIHGKSPKFVQEFSSGTTHAFCSLITSTSPVNDPTVEQDEDIVSQSSYFGALSYDGVVTWVSNGTIQLLEPAWSSSTPVTISYDSQDKMLIAVVSGYKELYYYLADVTKSSIEWSPRLILCKKITSTNVARVQSVIHNSDIIFARGNILKIYTLGEFLNGSTTKRVSLDNSSIITAIQSNNNDTPNILVGCSCGKLLIIDKKTTTIKHSQIVFATAVKHILQIPDHIDIAVAISASSTVALINSSACEVLVQIPGQGISIEKITIQPSLTQEESMPISTIQIFYNNGEKRSWNLDTLEEMYIYPRSPSSAYLPSFLENFEEPSDYVKLLPKQKSTRSDYYIPNSPNQFILLNLNHILEKCSVKPYSEDGLSTIRAIAHSLISINEKYAKNDWQKLLTTDTLGHVGMANEHSFWSVNSSLSTLTKVSSSTLVYLISLWVAFARLFLMSGDIEVSCEDLLDWLSEVMEFDNPAFTIDDFTTLVIDSTGELQVSALECLDALVSREKEENILKHWQPKLPSLSLDIFKFESLKAMVILSSLAKKLHSVESNNTSFIKEVAESLQLSLIGGSPASIRNTAILLIGSGWKSWQQSINPLTILDALITILYNHGFTETAEEKKETRLTLLCRKCIEQIALQNITLLISALAVQITDITKPVDSRITSVRLLSILVSSPHISIEPIYLPTIVGAAIKSLDSNDPTSRWQSSIGGTSLVTESIRFLSSVMTSYPNNVAFHKAQQRFAVCSTPEGIHPGTIKNAQKNLLIVGDVYDLRNGTLLASLGNNKLLGTYLISVKFSPDGKHLAGILASTTTVKYSVAIWKVEAGFLNIKFPSLSLGSHDESTAEKNITSSGTVIQPRLLRGISSSFGSDLNLEWIDENTVVVSSQSEDKTFQETFSIS